ncbi:APC family permease [archaeon]|nr:MAG: APC family permease [archaeon]
MEYVLYVATAVAEFGELMTTTTAAPRAISPLFWLLFYSVSLIFHVGGAKIFWRTSDFLAITTTLLIFVYLLSVCDVASFPTYALPDKPFMSNFQGFMFSYPLASWFFVGVEAMTLSCENIEDPTSKVPPAMAACVCTLFVTAMCILFATASTPPGLKDLPGELLPLNPGYEVVWGISSRMATVLALPGAFSTAYGFMFAYGRQLYAMSCSKLLPKFLSVTYGEHKAAASALLFGSILGLSILLVLYYTLPSFSRQLFNVCMLGSCIVNVYLFKAFVVCADRYSNMERQFVSPFGVYGAYYGMVVFSVMTVALAFFQDDNYLSLIVFCSFLAIICVHYHLVVRKREFFSVDEQRNFWKAYLLNANFKRKRRTSHRNTSFLRHLPWSITKQGSQRAFNDNASPIFNIQQIQSNRPFEANVGGKASTTSGSAGVSDEIGIAGSSFDDTDAVGEEKQSDAKEGPFWTQFFKIVRRRDKNGRLGSRVSHDGSEDGGTGAGSRGSQSQPLLTPYNEPVAGMLSASRPLLERHFLWDSQRIALTETKTVFLFPLVA